MYIKTCCRVEDQKWKRDFVYISTISNISTTKMNMSVPCLLAVAALLLVHTDATKLRKFRNRGVKRDFEAEEVMGSVRCQALGVNPLSGLGIQSVGVGFQQSDVNFDGTLRGREIENFEKVVETMIKCAEVDDRK